jgi:hypothetical protein
MEGGGKKSLKLRKTTRNRYCTTFDILQNTKTLLCCGCGKLIVRMARRNAMNIRQTMNYNQSTKVVIRGTPNKNINAKETAHYIAEMVLGLRNMAKSANFKTLQGLLEVSFYEASSAANKVEIPPEELEHLRELAKASGRHSTFR